jgi:predicted HTH transcriptional regulator
MRYSIFISGVQREFAEERRMLANYLQKDALFARFFDVFIFENLPAKNHQPEKAYIEEVKRCDIFLVLLGREYGYEFPDGTSPTQREYETATENNKYRLAYLTNIENDKRHVKTQNLIRQIADSIVYKIFSSSSELLSNVYTSLINFLVEKGELRVEPFDKSPNRDAELSDISDEKIEWFVRRARKERNFPLEIEDGKEKILTHLNLLNKGKVTNAAILLFGLQPQRFFLTSEVKCAHFYGTRVEKPIPSLQVYKGNLFELVDQAVDFVLSKIDFAVGTRKKMVAVPTAYEIPPEVIKEAIVNAVAHRDYDSNASVQVMLFRDRLEIFNPGYLPPQLSVETLKENHGSYPCNPLIADALYYVHYIERMGTGIQDIVNHCLEYGLPEPEFKLRDGFVSIIYRKQNVAFEKIDDEGGQKGGQKGDQRGGQKENISITDTQEKIIKAMSDNPKISRKDLSNILNINSSAIQKQIDRLKQIGVVERQGTDRDGNWKVNDMGFEKTDDEGGQKGGQRGGQKENISITDTQEKIIKAMSDNPKISRKALSDILNINSSAIQKQIDRLKQIGVVERQGHDRGGYWKINDVK